VVALLAVLGAIASGESALTTLESVFTWSALAAATLRYATPLLFGALGGVVSESSGVINIGLEGMMLMGAFWGIYGADLLHSWVWGVLVGMASGAVLGLLHAFFSIHLRANQIVSGTGINFLALGITGYFLEYHYGPNGTPLNISTIPNIHLPIQSVGFFGGAIGDANLMTWIGIALVPALTFFLFRTRWGLRLRSVGEKPRAADTVGLPVLRIRYAAVIASGSLAALGGAYLSVGFVGSFSNDMTNGRGFIALAAMIFGKWKPWGALWATLLFGFGNAMSDRVSSVNPTLGTLFEALPYVLTLVAVAGLVGRSRAPAADGIPYVRE
jgi:general nucleoside transport system permease protein